VTHRRLYKHVTEIVQHNQRKLKLCLIRAKRPLAVDIGGRDSSDGIATRYGLDGPRIHSRWWRDFTHPSTPRATGCGRVLLGESNAVVTDTDCASSSIPSAVSLLRRFFKGIVI
jgi:hypothetical protein